MKNVKNLLIAGALAVAVAAALAVKQRKNEGLAAPSQGGAPAVSNAAPALPAAQKLPRLVDLGADKCIPCKMMAPILEELKKTYAGRLQVDFIDVWKNQGAGEEYGVRVIPTQIFFSADGQELFRHEGFFSKEDILGQWAKLGVVLPPP